MIKKQRRATDDLNVALSGLSAALHIAKDVDTVEQAKRAIAMADEHMKAAWNAFGAIRAAADKI